MNLNLNRISVIFILSHVVVCGLGNAAVVAAAVPDQLSDPSNITYIESQISISSVDDDKYQNGLNLFGLFEGGETPLAVNGSYLGITGMDGSFVKTPLFDGGGISFTDVEWLNSTTIMADISGHPAFWNVVTDEIEYFYVANTFHDDMQYNSNSRTFMVLEHGLRFMPNPNGTLEEMIVDIVSEYTRKGDLIKQWDLIDYVNFTQYYDNLDRLNVTIETKMLGTKLYNYSIAANSMYWDTNENAVYVNLKNQNQVIKLNYNGFEPEWTIGQGANFTLFKLNDSETESLWYTAHDLNPIGNNEFLLFDSDYHNLTDIVGNYTQSSILKIKVDPANQTVSEVFRWLGPKSYISTLWGGVRKLTNGNYLVTFGAPIHGTNHSDPIHQSYGGVAVEITDTGQKVWEMRVPYNWGLNRLQRFNPVISVTPLDAVYGTVGDRLDFVWTDPFSNFPDTYEIYFNTETLLAQGEFDNEPISYSLSTTGLSEGDHIISLTLTDVVVNEKTVATKITVLLPATSKDDDGSAIEFLTLVNSIMLISVISRRIYRNG